MHNKPIQLKNTGLSHIDDYAKYCSISSALAVEIPQSSTMPLSLGTIHFVTLAAADGMEPILAKANEWTTLS